jgi:hypothetical protein
MKSVVFYNYDTLYEVWLLSEQTVHAAPDLNHWSQKSIYIAEPSPSCMLNNAPTVYAYYIIIYAMIYSIL